MVAVKCRDCICGWLANSLLIWLLGLHITKELDCFRNAFGFNEQLQ